MMKKKKRTISLKDVMSVQDNLSKMISVEYNSK